MIDIIKAIILGIVEGLTEFLPVSSTGHLIIINEWLSFSEQFTITFDIVIQLGAILAVIVLFWDRLYPFNKPKEKRDKIFRLWILTVIGVLPAVFFGVLFDDIIEKYLFNPLVVAVMLIIGGIVFFVVEKFDRKSEITNVDKLTYKKAFFIGLIQCLAMIPGTSRSASTIIGGMFLGLSRVVAAEFSFFLAIPTMIGATGYSLFKTSFALTGSEFVVLLVGFVISFIVALFVIKLFLDYVKKHDFKVFGYYRIILGVVVIAYFTLFKG